MIHIMSSSPIPAKSVALKVFVSTRVGEQIRNKIANLGDNLKYQLTIIQLLHTELKKESIEKGAQREPQKLEKEKEQSEEGGREGEHGTQLCAVWGQAQQKTFQLLFSEAAEHQVWVCITKSETTLERLVSTSLSSKVYSYCRHLTSLPTSRTQE